MGICIRGVTSTPIQRWRESTACSSLMRGMQSTQAMSCNSWRHHARTMHFCSCAGTVSTTLRSCAPVRSGEGQTCVVGP
jgi:hypothetical protein